MKIEQKYGSILKSTLEIDFQETGLNYHFQDTQFFSPPRVEKFFISYNNITNQKTYTTRSHPDAKKIVIILALIAAVFFIFFIRSSTTMISGSPYEFYFDIGINVLLISIFVFYRFIARQKMIFISEPSGVTFPIFNDNQAEEIIAKLFSNRNKYLREKFIEKDNYKSLTLELAEYLASIDVIDQDELIKLKEKIKSNSVGVVGFSVHDSSENNV